MTKLRIANDLKLPEDTVTSTLIVYGGKGMGKRISLDTPLPTPTGWTTMGDIRLGDCLFGEDGRICKVVYVSPVAQGDSFAVEFSDGSVIEADAEHIWSTETYQTRKRMRPPGLRTTAEIKATLTVRSGKTLAHSHSVLNTLPLRLPKIELPIDPYVLGAWLGDGSSGASVFTVGRGDEQTVREISAAGYPCKLVNQSDKTRPPMYYARNLKHCLRELGLVNNKHIPAIYLRASVEQRLALLQGLMDTDGGWCTPKGGTAEFSNTRECLSLGLFELVVSLGMKAYLTPRPEVFEGDVIGTDYRVRFVPTLPVFRLKRKASLCAFDCAQQGKRKRRYITAVRRIKSKPMRCIAVDSLNHLYLAGRSMIPTHNTNLGTVILEELSRAHLRWAALDPMGVLWGIRYSVDGGGPGVKCLILGGGTIALTLAGRDRAASTSSAMSLTELHESVLSRLDIAERKLLETLLQRYPDAVSHEDLAAAAGYTASGGSYAKAKGRLRAFGLALYPMPGYLSAAPLLFPEGLR